MRGGGGGGCWLVGGDEGGGVWDQGVTGSEVQGGAGMRMEARCYMTTTPVILSHPHLVHVRPHLSSPAYTTPEPSPCVCKPSPCPHPVHVRPHLTPHLTYTRPHLSPHLAPVCPHVPYQTYVCPNLSPHLVHVRQPVCRQGLEEAALHVLQVDHPRLRRPVERLEMQERWEGRQQATTSSAAMLIL